MTTNLITSFSAGTATTAQVPPGQHMLAISGTFDGAELTLFVKVRGVLAPLGTWSAPLASPFWLPRGTLLATLTDEGPSTSIKVAVAPLATRLSLRDSYTRLALAGEL